MPWKARRSGAPQDVVAQAADGGGCARGAVHEGRLAEGVADRARGHGAWTGTPPVAPSAELGTARPERPGDRERPDAANLLGISIASLACRDRQRAVLPVASARLSAATV